jgi:hypothetical protein
MTPPTVPHMQLEIATRAHDDVGGGKAVQMAF